LFVYLKTDNTAGLSLKFPSRRGNEQGAKGEYFSGVKPLRTRQLGGGGGDAQVGNFRIR